MPLEATDVVYLMEPVSTTSASAAVVASLAFANPLWWMFLLTYFYAGVQTWRLLFLLDPSSRYCDLDRALKHGDPAVWPVFVLFIVLWPILMLTAWAAVRLSPTKE